MTIPTFASYLGQDYQACREGGIRTRINVARRSEPGIPLVTVVTVVRNGEAMLERTICSVLNQTYKNIEYIVVDGASTDGTLELLKKYDDRIDYWISESDQGIYDAMNKGIRFSKGDTIGLLNCGDTYEKWFVERLVSEALHHGDVSEAVIYCHFKVLLDRLGLVQNHRSHLAYWRGMSICHQAMLIGKDVYRELGFYNTEFRLAADYEFLIRMATGGVRFILADAYGVTFRLGGESSVNMSESHAEARRINKVYLGAWSVRHLAFVALSWYYLISLVYFKRFAYQIFGERITNGIRRLKKYAFKSLNSPHSG